MKVIIALLITGAMHEIVNIKQYINISFKLRFNYILLVYNYNILIV